MRGFGSVSETLMMDRVMRQGTRDHSQVYKFINAEPDNKKQRRLWDLYHSFKYFWDTWDGVSKDQQKDPRFGKHAAHVWELQMAQTTGRKLFLHSVGGVISGLDTKFWYFWPTVQGINECEIAQMSHQLEIWKAIARGEALTQEETSTDDTDAIVVVDDGDDVPKGRVVGTIDNDDEVNVDGLDEEAVKEVAIAPDGAMDVTMDAPNDVTIADSGYAGNTTMETVSPAQTLPKPNVHIPDVDDEWSDDDWFNANCGNNNQSTPADLVDGAPVAPADVAPVAIAPVAIAPTPPAIGKTYFNCPIAPHYSHPYSTPTFTQTVDRSRLVLYFSRLRGSTKRSGHSNMNFLGRPFSVMENNIDLEPRRIRNPRLGVIGRQNAIRKSPNPMNYRLLDRKGSRGNSGRSGNESERSNTTITISPASATIVPTEPEPTIAPSTDIADEIRALVARVHELEAKLKK